MIEINLCETERELKSVLLDFCAQFKIPLSSGGVKLVVIEGERLSISARENVAVITYGKRVEIFMGLLIFAKRNDTNVYFEYSEKRNIENLAFMADNSRNAVMNISAIKRLIRLLAACGYNELQLYTEDTYEIDSEPYFGYLRGRYSRNELKEIDDYAFGYGIEVVACVQTLAHMNSIARWQNYSDIIDCNDILLAGDEKTYELIDKMFATYSDCLRSRKINIGMDEAHMVGLGKYLRKNGFCDRFEIMREHLGRVLAIAEKYGYNASMWSDMYFRLAFDGDYHCTDKLMSQKIIDQVPKNVQLIYWDYDHLDKASYQKMIRQHLRINSNIAAAGGVWKWIGYAPDNRYSMAASDAFLRAAIESGIQSFTLTAWGDDGAECSVFSALPTIVSCARNAYGSFCKNEIASSFLRVTGCELDAFLSVDLPNRHSCENIPQYKNNSSRYLLYNDCFLGIFDGLATQANISLMEKNLAIISNAKNNCADFEYVFSTLEKLQMVNICKLRLASDTKKAYISKDKRLLIAIVARYDGCIKLIEQLYSAFKTQWYTDNKPFGFEVQDMRLGGLIMRVKNCSSRLMEFIDGNIDVIEELEQQLLPVCENENINDFVFQSHLKNVTVGVI